MAATKKGFKDATKKVLRRYAKLIEQKNFAEARKMKGIIENDWQSKHGEEHPGTIPVPEPEPKPTKNRRAELQHLENSDTEDSDGSADPDDPDSDQDEFPAIPNLRMFMDQYMMENGWEDDPRISVDHLRQRRWTIMGQYVPDTDPDVDLDNVNNLDTTLIPYTTPSLENNVASYNPLNDPRFLTNRRNELESTYGTYSVIDGGS